MSTGKERKSGLVNPLPNHIFDYCTDIQREQREALKQQRACVIWFTGLSGAGKSAIANQVEKILNEHGVHTYLLDGDNVRKGLNSDLGFSEAAREENIRRISEVSALMVDAGLIVLSAFISPFARDRALARTKVPDGDFIEVFVDTPLELAEQRDPKGLYKKARKGEIKNFTGIDSPYEPPEYPEIRINTENMSQYCAAQYIIDYLQKHNFIH